MSKLDNFISCGVFVSALLTLSTLFYDCRPLRLLFLVLLLIFQIAFYRRAKKKDKYL